MPHTKSHDKSNTAQSSGLHHVGCPSASSAASSTSYGLFISEKDPSDSLVKAHKCFDAAVSSVQEYLGFHSGHIKKLEHKYGDVFKDASHLNDIAFPLLSALPALVEIASVKKIINKFTNNVQVLLQLLDDVAQVHPFIKLAVGAFRVAVGLHLAREENDEKLSLLLVAMRDMMAVLVQLKNINEHKCAGEGNITIAIYMKDLIEHATEDITNCAKSCHDYAHTHLLAKVLLSASWRTEFKYYMTRFTAHHSDFVLALSVYTSQATDAANEKLDMAHSKLDTVHGKLDTAHSKLDIGISKVTSIEEKFDRLFAVLGPCASPEERELENLIDDHGGAEKVSENESLLRELFDRHRKPWGGVCRPGLAAGEPHREAHSFKSLQEELQKKNRVRTTIRENMAQVVRELEHRIEALRCTTL